MLLLLLLIMIVLPSSVSAASWTSSTGTFYRDVLNPVETRASLLQNEGQIQSALLQKAMLRKDFEAKYGVSLDGATATAATEGNRKLEDESEDNENDNDDDYYMNSNYMFSFSGYSMKFAKCQPVQYFSESALQAGEHSPMVTDDIVILRLCPTSSCKSSSSDTSSSSSSSSSTNTNNNMYGCQYNFSEYAIELSEYVRIMLRYSAQKRDYMCTYCASCLNGGSGSGNNARRRLEDAQGESGDEQDEEEQQQQQQQANNNNNNNNGADDYYRVDDDYVVAAANAADDAAMDDYAAAAAADTDDYYKNACSTWSTYCSDYGDLCSVDDEDNNNNNQYYSSYLDFEDYLDYLDCAQVKLNDYAYFVRPRCDGYQGTIKMAVYYDNYCVQYAGNEVSLKNLGLGFRESAFADFYSGKCLDCSESVRESCHVPYFYLDLSLCS